MTTHLLLRGGPLHDFDATGELLCDIFAERGIDSTVLDDPRALIDAVAGHEPSAGRLCITVHALFWNRRDERWGAAPGQRLTERDEQVLAGAVHDGAALLALHTAVICFEGSRTWRSLCGGAWDWQRSSHPPLGPVEVRRTEAGRVHPITATVQDFVVDDELYGPLDMVDGVEPLLEALRDGSAMPLLWTRRRGSGRVVTDLLGHGAASLDHPMHRRALQLAVTWLIDEGGEGA